MRCARCAAEIPGQAQFCMRCGTPVNVGRPGGPAAAAHPAISYPAQPSKSKLRAVLAGLGILAAIGALVAFKLRPNPKVTDMNARPGNTGALTDANARVANTGPVADRGGKMGPGPSDPTDVIDYLKHVREIERQRVALSKQQLGQALTWSSQLTARTLTAEMGDNPEAAHQKTYNDFQNSFSQWSGQWEELSRRFNSYPKPVPQACSMLRDKYLDVLGKTSSSMTTVGSSFASAMSGNAGGAVEALTSMQGSASAEIDRSCEQADSEVAAVCKKYNISKDFDIKADGGASNPFGVGR
jgi:hypothetical protein